jgi:hypothetical protein
LPTDKVQFYIRGSQPKPTAVYDSYWHFAAERQNVFFRRVQRELPPWTDDSIILNHRFTNAYRASDRVSQYLIKNVIGDQRHSVNETFFRIMLFKIFNRISTWQLLEQEIGNISLQQYDYSLYDQVICNAMAAKRRIFSSAYIMPSGSSAFGSQLKHQNCLRLIEVMINDELPSRLADSKSLKEVVEMLKEYPMIGDFLSYQYAIDLNYSDEIINFSEMDYVKPGPGALDGISKCFSNLGDYDEAGIIRWVTDRQDKEFSKRNIAFKDLWGRRLHLIDCQNLFCEISKYARVAHPTVTGVSERTRIKQKYTAGIALEEQWYPPKWGINERIGITEALDGHL